MVQFSPGERCSCAVSVEFISVPIVFAVIVGVPAMRFRTIYLFSVHSLTLVLVPTFVNLYFVRRLLQKSALSCGVAEEAPWYTQRVLPAQPQLTTQPHSKRSVYFGHG